MATVYCDTNIYSILFNKEHKFYSENLKNTFDDFKDVLTFIFSDAHLTDLNNSSEDYRNRQLTFMEKYVKDNYFTYLTNEKYSKYYLATPLEAYNGRDFKSYNDFFNTPFDINNLFKEFEGEEMYERLIKTIFDNIFNQPHQNLIPIPENADEKSLKFFDKVIPKGENLSFGDFINHTMNYGIELLTNSKEVSELRNYVSSYINRDDYSFDNWGQEFDEKLKETSFQQSFTEIFEKTDEINNKDKNFYDSFILYYNLLELLNITKEKSGGKTKKFNLNSLTADANHAYYASDSDYLITDDKGLQVKAFLTYKFFKIPTKIYSLNDFLNLKTIIINQEEKDITKFFESIVFEMKNSLVLIEQFDLKTNSNVRTFKPNYHFFNFFDRFQVATNKDYNKIVLYRKRTGFLYRELETLVNKLINLFGNDQENKGYFDFNNEKKIEDDVIRGWNIGKAEILLAKSNKSIGLFITFYDNNQNELII